MSSNLFTACLYSEICFFSVQPVSNFIYNPFLNFSWYWVFHLHQRLSHCSEGLEDTLHLTGGTCAYLYIFFQSFLIHLSRTVGTGSTCTLLSSVSLSFTTSSSSLPLQSSIFFSWSSSFLTVTSFFSTSFAFDFFLE